MTQTVTTHVAPRRRVFFRDFDGLETAEKRYDEIVSYPVDFTDWLDSGETISSVSWDFSGVTDEGSSNTTTTITMLVSGLGEVEAEITTSASRKLEVKYRFRSAETHVEDYSK